MQTDQFGMTSTAHLPSSQGHQLLGLDFLCTFIVENLENLEQLIEENNNHL